MEQISLLERSDLSKKFAGLNTSEKIASFERSGTNPVLENILSEGGDDFFRYLSWIGLAKEPNLMVLSSMHHYYYDHNDLIGIRTLINLKRLNQVKHLESFIHTIYRILPAKAFFVGCFRNYTRNGKGLNNHQPAKFIDGLMNIFDSRSERSLSKSSVIILMEEQRFKVIDMTEINGMTYFWAQSNRKPCE
jgi:hypothetical protein